MMPIQRAVGAGLLLLAGTGTGCAVDQSAPARGQELVPDGLAVSTAPLGMPQAGKARLAMTLAFDDQQQVPVTIQFEDASGRVLARRQGVIGPNQPVIEELDRADIESTDTVLLQTRVVFGPLDPGSEESCPVNLTLEIIPDDDEGYEYRKTGSALGGARTGERDSGSAYTCPGIDPCRGGGTETHGPGAGSGVFPLCASRSTYGDDSDGDNPDS